MNTKKGTSKLPAMETKVIKVTSPGLIARIKEILAEKELLHKKIKEGKISEIKSEIRLR